MNRKSFSLQLREILNVPIKARPLWYKLFLPLFFIVSYTIYITAKRRRKRSYRIDSYLRRNDKSDALSSRGEPTGDAAGSILCVGNILIGGTGKSPIVQTIAQEYLEKNFIVAIASRGITPIKKPIYVQGTNANIGLLSDENREHYELLKSKNLADNLFVLQNKNRSEALSYFREKLGMDPRLRGDDGALHRNSPRDDEYASPSFPRRRESSVPSPNNVFILDDGLQHFSCPRDINLCVWQPDLLLNSPPYAMPLGPYREGFGKKSFQELLNAFDLRIWSRTPFSELSLFTKKITLALKKYDLAPSNKDLIACYELKIMKLDPEMSSSSLARENYAISLDPPVKPGDDKHAPEDDADRARHDVQEATVITGIANPAAFLNDLKKKFPNCSNWSTLFLKDHAPFQLSIIEMIEKSSCCIFTLKDFYRWCEEDAFKKAIFGKIIYGCSIELKFYDILGNIVEITSILDLLRNSKFEATRARTTRIFS